MVGLLLAARVEGLPDYNVIGHDCLLFYSYQTEMLGARLSFPRLVYLER